MAPKTNKVALAEDQEPLLPPTPQADEAQKPRADGAADVIIVFYHGATDNDSKTINGDDFLDQALVDKEKAQAGFATLTQLCKGQSPALKDVRDAFLRDLKDWLVDMGLDVRFFLSSDKDELFMRISLDKPDVEEFYAEEFYLPLQLKDGVRKALGIRYEEEPEQDVAVTMQPYMPFSKDIETDKAKELGIDGVFRKFKLRNPSGGILKMTDRIRCIELIISRVIDIQDVIGEDVVKDYFPVHLRAPCWELRAQWASFKFKKVFDIRARQPLDRIGNYFGHHVAFGFAWMGETVRQLAFLACLGCAAKGLIVQGWVSEDHGILGWGGVMVIWGAVYTKGWARVESSLAITWNRDSLHGVERKRPNFRGEMLPSPLNVNEKKRQSSAFWTAFFKGFSHLVTLCFCVATSASIYLIWGQRPRANELLGEYGLGEYGPTAISCAISATIIVGNQVFSKVAQGLLWLENPETLAEYANSMVVKKFSFQCINSYNAFIYIAFFERQDETVPCPDDDCIALLSTSLMTTYATLAASTLVSLILPFLMLRWSLYTEEKKARKLMEDRGETGDVTKLVYMEIQAKMNEYSVDEQIDDMLSFVIAVGYVLLFGGVCPFVIFIALIVFMVQMRAVAWKLCRLTKRPFPIATHGLGAWNDMLNTLAWLGMFATVLIPILNMEMFDEFSTAKKMLVFFGVEHLFIFFRLSIALLIPDIPASADLLKRRRNYIMHRLLAGKAEKKRTWDPHKLVRPSKEGGPMKPLHQLPDWAIVDKIPLMTLCGSTKESEDALPDEDGLGADRDDKV